MQSVPQSSGNIQINMLGEFSICIDNHVITHNKGRTKRVWTLIEYLIANRKKDVSVDKIIEILWPEDECNDPLNALKNLVYRARELLKDLSGDETTEYITFTRNSYAWNGNLPCHVDVDQFESCWKAASCKNRLPQERIAKYYEALNLYKGEFLPKSSFANWVISANAYYSTIYNECVIAVSNLLMDEQQFDEVIRICESALTYSLFEEKIHKTLLYAYISAHRYDKALEHYQYVTKLFQKEFGVNASDSFGKIYRKIQNCFTNVELNLTAMQEDFKEVCNAEGAFYCDYDVFKNLYCVQTRSQCRTGQSVYLVLFTLNDCNGNLADNQMAKTALEILKSAIIGSIRKGDVVSACSSVQFIIMLPLINYENAQIVVARIQNSFYMHYRKNDIRILAKINSVDSIDTPIPSVAPHLFSKKAEKSNKEGGGHTTLERCTY